MFAHTAAQPATELQLRHGQEQCRVDVLQTPGGVVNHVPHDAGQELRHG